MRHRDLFVPIIYKLIDKETRECHYVGQTIRPIGRLMIYKNISERGFPSKRRRGFCGNGPLRVFLSKKNWKMVILERVADARDLGKAEKSWIRKMRKQGVRLLNLTDGGEGLSGWSHSLETRAKIGAANRGRIYSQETLERMRAANAFRRGQALPEEHRAKISASLRGRFVSLEQRAKHSLAARWQWSDPDSRSRIEASIKKAAKAGKYCHHPTEATRQKLSAAAKQQWSNPELRARNLAGRRSEKSE